MNLENSLRQIEPDDSDGLHDTAPRRDVPDDDTPRTARQAEVVHTITSDRIPKRSTAVLTNNRRQPWTSDGFGTAFNRSKKDAGMAERDLHFHDLRGTAATRFYAAGLSERVIAEIMGWEEAHVARIIRRYVDRTALTRATIETLNQTERRTESAKPTAKP